MRILSEKCSVAEKQHLCEYIFRAISVVCREYMGDKYTTNVNEQLNFLAAHFKIYKKI